MHGMDLDTWIVVGYNWYLVSLLCTCGRVVR
jgi:hypothetical protein